MDGTIEGVVVVVRETRVGGRRAAARGLTRAATRRAREREGSTARFVDLETGVRARYVRKGGSERVVIVLHDVGECAEMHEGLARAERERIRDVRAGLSRTRWNVGVEGGTVRGEDLSDDVEAFVVALDLYVRPVCLVGFGMGGVVACETARRWPRLVAATVVVECAPTVPPRMYSHCSVQAMVCASVEEVARALASPVFEDGDEAASMSGRLQTRVSTRGDVHDDDDDDGKDARNETIWCRGDEIVRWRMDPTFYFTYDVDALRVARDQRVSLRVGVRRTLVARGPSHGVARRRRGVSRGENIARVRRAGSVSTHHGRCVRRRAGRRAARRRARRRRHARRE